MEMNILSFDTFMKVKYYKTLLDNIHDLNVRKAVIIAFSQGLNCKLWSDSIQQLWDIWDKLYGFMMQNYDTFYTTANQAIIMATFIGGSLWKTIVL